MNFKFLFNDNLADNRLMLRVISSVPGIPMSPASSIPTLNEEEEELLNSLAQATTSLPKSIMFNGKDTGYIYDNNLSARKNRKLLKLTLKAKGLGDKADATGLISEYLTSQGGAKGKDAAWLAKKAHQYEYTTDGSGNVDYHRKVTPFDNFVGIVGGSLLGPLGATLGWGLTNNWGLKSKNNNAISGFRTPQSNVVTNNVIAKEDTPVTTEPVTTTPVDNESTLSTQPINYTFTGFSGHWGDKAQQVYNKNKDAAIWKTIAGDDNDITLEEFMNWLRTNNVAGGADGKLGFNTLNALGFGDQRGMYSWMSINPKPTANANTTANTNPVIPIDDSTELPEGHLLRRPQEEQQTQTTYFYENLPSFVPGTQITNGGTNGGNNALTGAQNYYTSYGLEEDFDDLYMQRLGVTDSYSKAQARKTPEYQQAMLLFKDLYDYNGFTLGNAYTLKPSKEAYKKGFMLLGGTLKYQQGGLMLDLDKLLLASTLGLIGYAQSQGKLMQVEEAVSLVAQLALSQPESLQELASNKELVNAGILIVGLETVQKLSQPGVMKLLLSNIVNKMPKAMKGTKLNYIKELKGICPEGYEMQYFAAGGHLCSRCAAKKKIEEAKCGKKMKAKKHEGGGGVSTTVNDIKNLMKDNQQTPQKQTSKKQAPKKMVYNQKEHDRLIKEFQTNPKGKFSYKGWPKAKQDSLTWFNANNPREDGV